MKQNRPACGLRIHAGHTNERKHMNNERSWKVTPPILLGIVFVTLKLCGVIGWSWWWVTLPFWIAYAAGVAVLALLLLVKVIAKFFK